MNIEKIYDIVYGNIIGGAIGDALGGPVEMVSHYELKNLKEGGVTDLLTYASNKLSAHGAHQVDRGTITDDTRLKMLVLESILNRRKVNEESLKKVIVERYYASEKTSLMNEWLDEYVQLILGGKEKQIFGGQQVNAGAMSSAIIGVFNLFDSFKGFEEAYDNIFYTNTNGRYSAGLVSSLAANYPDKSKTIVEIIDQSYHDLRLKKKYGETLRWQRSDFYKYCGVENEMAIAKGITLSEKFTIDHQLAYQYFLENYPEKYQYEALETDVIVYSILLYAQEDFALGVLTAVNMGRDNDSSAGIIGSLIGSRIGASKINPKWIETVESANEEWEFSKKAWQLSELIYEDLQFQKQRVEKLSVKK